MVAEVLPIPVDQDQYVQELAARLARRAGRRQEPLLRQLCALADEFSATAVIAVARATFQEHDLEFPAVKKRVLDFVNTGPSRWAACTGGRTALEISPNGGYGRCTRTGTLQRYMGNIRDEGPIRTLDLEKDDLRCELKCPQLICFSNNVLRGLTRADLDQQIARSGVRGVYKQADSGRNSDIFVRWKITDACNFTCAYCTDWQSVNAKGLETTDAEVMAGAAKMVSQFRLISLRLTGGEPSARRCFVDLMRFFHSNLIKFTNIEIRTNLSYQAKHREILSWDWHGKLHIHVGCHIRDKSFMPWRTVELLKGAPNADYILKFVSTPTLREHVQFFKNYFIENGIPPERIRVIEEVFGKDTGTAQAEPAPFARTFIEEGSRRKITPNLAPALLIRHSEQQAFLSRRPSVVDPVPAS